MADGRLIVEIYEYAETSNTIPRFEYIPCNLGTCMPGNYAKLSEIIQGGFDAMPKRDLDESRLPEIMNKLNEAGFGKITVAYHPRRAGHDESVELTNVRPVSLEYADVRHARGNTDDIILHDQYQLSEGNETTELKDAHRLTLIYRNRDRDGEAFGYAPDDDSEKKEICLNITFLQW